MDRKRRDFIKSAGKIGVGLGCMGGIITLKSCVANYLVTSVDGKDFITIDKAVLSDQETGEIKHFVTVRSQKFKEPIYLSGLKNEDYQAVLLHCTHKGCEVRPAGDLLMCPCHGSEFDQLGKVLKSPAEENLARFQVSHDEQSVYIKFQLI